jgi:hypothetical protein
MDNIDDDNNGDMDNIDDLNSNKWQL